MGPWLGVVVWVALPVAAIAVISTTDDASEAPTVERAWAPVGWSTAQRSQRVGLAVTYSDPQQLFAPAGWTGLVESVAVQPGAALASGDLLATVGGVQRLAGLTGVPFTRPLQGGVAGPDVAALNSLLATLGLAAGAGDRFGAETERGVIALSRRVGAPASAVFDPAWVVFVPDGAVVGKVLLQPSMVAPGGGEAIVELVPVLRSATWAAPEGAVNAQPRPEPVPSAELVVYGQVVGQLAESELGAPGLQRPELLAALSTVLPAGATAAEAVLRSAAPAGTATVAASAIFSDSAGRTCMVWRAGTGGRPRRAQVVVTGSNFGEATVSDLPAEAAEVRINPSPDQRADCG